MATYPKSFWGRIWRSRYHKTRSSQSSRGFTLVELLITMLLASGIIAGLMYLIVELLGTNQRESARAETERDMQNAIDYISNELREATYVYPGECLTGVGAKGDPDFCPGLINHLPNNFTQDSVPIVAFWRNEQLPAAVRNKCSQGQSPNDAAGDNANCSTGHAYTLIVYSLSEYNPNDTWQGKARITRYQLSQFSSTGTPTTGYTAPEQNATGIPEFRAWPFTSSQSDAVNQQPGTPTNRADALVDFVDVSLEDETQFVDGAACPSDEYEVSPPDALLDAEGFNDVRSFYVCILQPPQNAASGANVEVLVHLRGNAYGKPGVLDENAYLNALETRVLSRVVIGKSPQ